MRIFDTAAASGLQKNDDRRCIVVGVTLFSNGSIFVTIRYLPLAALFCLAALSCSARIDGRLSADGRAEISLRAGLEPRMAVLIGTLSGLDGRAPEGLPLVDGSAVAASLRASPGIGSAVLSNLDRRTVSGTISVTDIDSFLSPSAGTGRFARYERTSSGGGSLVIALDRSTAPQVLERISADVVDYLSALMAPAATGEALSRKEYLDLVSSVYGPGIAEELGAARLRAAVEVPGTVVSVSGGAYSGKQATFDLPLLDVLVLDTPVRLEVRWK